MDIFKKILLSAVFLLIAPIIVQGSYGIDQFNDSTNTSGTLMLNGALNDIVKYIALPSGLDYIIKNITLENNIYNITALQTFSYDAPDSWNTTMTENITDPENMVDGDWATYGNFSGYARLYANWTINDTNIYRCNLSHEVEVNSGVQNIFIVSGCRQNPIQIRTRMQYNGLATEIWFDCYNYNTSSWSQIDDNTAPSSKKTKIYDMNVTCLNNITTTYSSLNVSIYANDTLIYNLTGAFPDTPTPIELNLTPCAMGQNCKINITNAVASASLNWSDMKIWARNHTFTYPSGNVIAGVNYSYYLNLTYDSDYVPIPSCNVTINDTNYVLDQTSFSGEIIQCAGSFPVNLPDGTYTINSTYAYGSQVFTTSNQNITILGVNVSVCGSPFNNTILNISYYDESTLAAINLTNTYDLYFDDGTSVKHRTGTFTNAYSNRFCANINSSRANYTLDVYGQFQLSKSEYVSRAYNIPASTPISVSNNPQYNLSLYLISLANTTAVQFTWITSTYQLIDGTMRIYKCTNTTKALVSSIPIISGSATSVIEPFTAQYAYDVIFNGVTYADEGSYFQCHVEASTDVTYFVQIPTTNATAELGLSSIQCDLTRNSNTSVTMTWGPNPIDGSYVQGCIEVWINNANGNMTIYSITCSSEAEVELFGYTKTATIPIGNYTAYAAVHSGSVNLYCGNPLQFKQETYANQVFGTSGLLAGIFLVIAMFLFFAGSGELSLVGAGIGLITLFALGITNFGWVMVGAAIFLIIFVIYIGRYGRQT